MIRYDEAVISNYIIAFSPAVICNNHHVSSVLKSIRKKKKIRQIIFVKSVEIFTNWLMMIFLLNDRFHYL